MTQDCPDDKCAKKIHAIDSAIGYDRSNWSVILEKTDNVSDVANALRFCEAFKLEAKVKVTSDGYQVLVKETLRRLL